MDDGKISGVVFLDVCKAFDSVNHGIRDTELKWFQSYLKDRKQVCFVNDQIFFCKENNMWNSTRINTWSAVVFATY